VLAKKVKQQIFIKKQKKLQKLQLKPNGGKKFKKFLLIKKFQEEDENWSEAQKQEFLKRKNDLTIKYSLVRQKQEASQEEGKEEQKGAETLADILAGIKEELFSELDANEIPDSEISDVNEEEIKIDHVDLMKEESDMNMDAKAEVFEQIHE